MSCMMTGTAVDNRTTIIGAPSAKIASTLLTGALALVAMEVASAKTIFTYPECGATVQQCIDASAPGDVVQIATNQPIDESPRISHSLVLKSAPGFTATFPGFNSVIGTVSGSEDGSIVVRGLKLETGRIFLASGTSGKFTAVVRDNKIATGITFGSGIEVRTGTEGEDRGPIFVNIRDNVVYVPGRGASGQSNGISVSTSRSPKLRGVISGNQIAIEDNGQGDGISLPNGNNSLNVDVIDNVITGRDYGSGISVFQFGEGELKTRLLNNLITGENGNAGRPAGISISGSRGSLDFIAINNTIVKNRNGVSIGGRKDLGASIKGAVVNNIIADNFNIGLSIDNDFEDVVINKHNLIFGNGSNFFTPGPGTIEADPKFLASGLYRPSPDSPAVNAGDNHSVPSFLAFALGGNLRILDFTVDIGAYESPCPEGTNAGEEWTNIDTAPTYISSGICKAG